MTGSNHPPSDLRLGLLFGITGVLIFSGTLPATRLIIDTFDPWFLTFGRALLASVAATVVLLITQKAFPRHEAPALLASGILLVFGFPGCIALAMTSVPSSHGGVVLGIMPLATALFATLLAGERAGALFWICSLAGSALVVVFALRDGGWGFAVGDFWLVGAIICASCGYVMSAKLSHRLPAWEVISWALILTLPLSLAGAILLWDPTYSTFSATDGVAFAYLGLGSMYLGFFAWNAGLRRGGMARIGQLQLLQTFFTLAIAAVVLGEHITLQTLGYALAIFIIIFIGQRARIDRRP